MKKVAWNYAMKQGGKVAKNRQESVQEKQHGTTQKLCKKSSQKLVNNVSKEVERNQARKSGKNQIPNSQGIMQQYSKELVKKVCK